MRRPRLNAVAAPAMVLAVGALLAGCSGAESSGLTVYAAASLAAPFTELAEGFEREHPDLPLAPLVVDGSATLATQLLEGAPADVFAAADRQTMRRVETAVDAPEVFARNVLQIAVEPGNPLSIEALGDLAADGVDVVLCAPEVPCGAAAHALLDEVGAEVEPVSEEQNVTAVLTKVAAGDADAGLVYVTDVAASDGAVDRIDIPHADAAANDYVIAALRESNDARAARAFVDYVLSAEGRAVLARHGFILP